jgi:hypothetical protein
MVLLSKILKAGFFVTVEEMTGVVKPGWGADDSIQEL